MVCQLYGQALPVQCNHHISGHGQTCPQSTHVGILPRKREAGVSPFWSWADRMQKAGCSTFIDLEPACSKRCPLNQTTDKGPTLSRLVSNVVQVTADIGGTAETALLLHTAEWQVSLLTISPLVHFDAIKTCLVSRLVSCVVQVTADVGGTAVAVPVSETALPLHTALIPSQSAQNTAHCSVDELKNCLVSRLVSHLIQVAADVGGTGARGARLVPSG